MPGNAGRAIALVVVVGLSLAATACAQGLFRDSPAVSNEEREKRVVANMVLWAKYVKQLRTDKELTKPQREATAAQIVLWATEAETLIRRLRPDFATPPGPTHAQLYEYVQSLIRKHSPDKEAGFRAEADRILVADTRALLRTLAAALRAYQDDTGRYPDSGNVALAKQLTSGDTPYATLSTRSIDKEGRVVDAWGRPLVYRRDSPSEYTLYALGPNGKDDKGTEDDILPPKPEPGK